MTYTTDQSFRATECKTRTTALPDEARAPAAYIRDGRSVSAEVDFCLPAP